MYSIGNLDNIDNIDIDNVHVDNASIDVGDDACMHACLAKMNFVCVARAPASGTLTQAEYLFCSCVSVCFSRTPTCSSSSMTPVPLFYYCDNRLRHVPYLSPVSHLSTIPCPQPAPYPLSPFTTPSPIPYSPLSPPRALSPVPVPSPSHVPFLSCSAAWHVAVLLPPIGNEAVKEEMLARSLSLIHTNEAVDITCESKEDCDILGEWIDAKWSVAM